MEVTILPAAVLRMGYSPGAVWPLPDTTSDPYDMLLRTNDWTSPPIHTWAAGVRAQLDVELAGLEEFPDRDRRVSATGQFPGDQPAKYPVTGCGF